MPAAYEYDRARPPVRKTAESASLGEVIDVMLDKGIVVDAWGRVSVPGLGPMTIKAHMVVTSVDTLLRYAEEIGLPRLAARASSGGDREDVDGS